MYMGHHNLTNECIVVDNMNSVEKREDTVWQKIIYTWKNEKKSPMTMALSPKLSTQFVNSWVITFDFCLKHAAATPDKCTNQFATLIVELHRLIGLWSLSGKGDEDLDEYDADNKNNNFGNLSCCSQGALDSRANFLGTSQPYILYLWEYLNAHNLLKMSFQRLDPKVAAKNGGKGVPSIICSLPKKCSPSDTSSMELTNRENEDAISVSITLLEENNLRAVRVKSNATEKNTLRNLIHNLQMQKRQVIVDRLKAMASFDDLLAQSLTEQIGEIDKEIKQYTKDLDSVQCSEHSTPPRKNPRT